LKTYVTDWSRQNEIDVNLSFEGAGTLPFAIEQTLFRIAQESLANVTRHSGATCVDIQLAYESEAVRLTITDNGCGFDPASASGSGVGLLSMAERTGAVAGKLEINSAPGRGTRILARCPVDGGNL
jgi:signal transduction histidine kinase